MKTGGSFMKKFFILAALLIASPALYADQLFLYINSTITGEITEVSSEFIKYKSESGDITEIARSEVEKIVYTGGREVDFTDKIFLKDKTVISGKVTGKNGEYIEYNPAGAPPYDRIPASSVSKIIYSNGTVEDFMIKNNMDKIYLKDGRVFEGKNISVYDRYIEFYNKSGVKETYGKNIIDKIIYSSGEVRTFTPQEASNTRQKETAQEESYNSPIAFAEFEIGWNGYAGGGARLDYFITDSFSVNGALGLCLWGYRASAAARYYPDGPYGLAFSIGVAYNTGGPYEYDYETEDPSGNTDSEKVTFDMKPVVTINASILYSWKVNDKDRIYIETGYGYAIQDEKYTYESESGRELSEESEDIMDVMAPGGFILSIGYAFRL